MDLLQAQVMQSAESMKTFADGDPSFVLGQWRDWKSECFKQNRMIPPKEFKANNQRLNAG
jgi:hypothetical protein